MEYPPNQCAKCGGVGTISVSYYEEANRIHPYFNLPESIRVSCSSCQASYSIPTYNAMKQKKPKEAVRIMERVKRWASSLVGIISDKMRGRGSDGE